MSCAIVQSVTSHKLTHNTNNKNNNNNNEKQFWYQFSIVSADVQIQDIGIKP